VDCHPARRRRKTEGCPLHLSPCRALYEPACPGRASIYRPRVESPEGHRSQISWAPRTIPRRDFSTRMGGRPRSFDASGGSRASEFIAKSWLAGKIAVSSGASPGPSAFLRRVPNTDSSSSIAQGQDQKSPKGPLPGKGASAISALYNDERAGPFWGAAPGAPSGPRNTTSGSLSRPVEPWVARERSTRAGAGRPPMGKPGARCRPAQAR